MDIQWLFSKWSMLNMEALHIFWNISLLSSICHWMCHYIICKSPCSQFQPLILSWTFSFMRASFIFCKFTYSPVQCSEVSDDSHYSEAAQIRMNYFLYAHSIIRNIFIQYPFFSFEICCLSLPLPLPLLLALGPHCSIFSVHSMSLPICATNGELSIVLSAYTLSIVCRVLQLKLS